MFQRYFMALRPHEVKNICGKRKFSGMEVYLSGTRDQNGELLVVASNMGDAEQLVPIYGMRWKIESFFQALKGRGFNFEQTHLTDPTKIAKLMALLAVGVVWAHNYFRYGLDMIANAYQKTIITVKDFNLCLRILRKPIQVLLQ